MDHHMSYGTRTEVVKSFISKGAWWRYSMKGYYEDMLYEAYYRVLVKNNVDE